MPSSQSFDPSRGDASAAAPGPVFVSRSALAKRDDAPLRASDGGALPSLSDSRVRWMIALTIALQIWAWWRVDGFQLADSVEFMERARSFVRGEPLIDAGVIRPFGFSFLFVPFFALAEWFGITDQRAVVWCVTLFQMALGCVLVWRSMRLGARVSGSTGAFAAGLFVACNPVLLQYSTQPVSDIAGGVCVAFALEGVLERGSFRRAFLAGLWLALGFMVAYKTLLVTLAVMAVVFLRDRWKHSATWRGLGVGVSIGLLLQSSLDWIMYGTFGASVGNYVVQNAGSVVASVIQKLAVWTQSKSVYDFGTWVYDLRGDLGTAEDELAAVNMPAARVMKIHGLQGPWFYVFELPTFVVWPALTLLAAAVVRALRRPTWMVWLPVGVVVLCFLVLSNKGNKDFRLWLPLLPFLALIFVSGWAWIVGAFGGLRGLVTTLATAAVLVFAVRQLASINVRQYGGYWDAIDWVDARARATLDARREAARVTGKLGEPTPLRVGSAYNWAVFLRSSPLIEVVKLPWQLNLWKNYEKLDAEGRPPKDGQLKKNADFATIADLDVFLVHHPILSQNHDLMRWVNAHFAVVGAFYDQRTYAGLGPIYVLERRTGGSDARTFFDLVAANEATLLASTRLPGRALDFIGPGGDCLQLLSVAYQTLPPQEFGWITYRWRADGPLSHDFRIVDRITSPDERNVWQNNHAPAYGTAPTSQWTAGEILSESYLVVPSHDPFSPDGRVRPIGGGYRRGDLIPTRTWMQVRAYDPASLEPGQTPRVVAGLEPARVGEAQPIRASGAEGAHETPDGIQFSADDYVRVAGFFVPVRTPWRLRDDGRPVPP